MISLDLRGCSQRVSSAVLLLAVLLHPAAALAACREPGLAGRFPAVAYAAEPEATIQYFGHNFFLITTRQGTQIVTDPLAPGMYPTPDLSPHVVTIGREHPNHNFVAILRGSPLILRGLTRGGADWNRVSTTVKEVAISSIPIYQSGIEGTLKGSAFLFDLGTLCIAHLGDLSHTLAAEQLTEIGRVDVALIPIGGVFTMPPKTAREVLQQLKPKIAIPMHYRDALSILEVFVQGLPTRRLSGDTLTVSRSSLPASTEIVVLTPRGARDEAP